jgi:hypothetical protein
MAGLEGLRGPAQRNCRWRPTSSTGCRPHRTSRREPGRAGARGWSLQREIACLRRSGEDRNASVVIRGHAFIQNLRRGHYELGMDARPRVTLAAAFVV